MIESRNLVRAVMGIDPGVAGGFVIIGQTTRTEGEIIRIESFRNHWTHTEFIRTLSSGLSDLRELNVGVPTYWRDSVFLEKVGYMGMRVGKDGRLHKDGGKGAFTFGRVDGLIRGVVLTLGYSVNEVNPMLWQGALGCMSGGDKCLLRTKAEEMWPNHRWTLQTSDAALIAEYGRRRNLR